MPKRSLPKLNDCVETMPRPVSLSDKRISMSLFAFFVIALLCLAHVYLRFAIRDMRNQHRQMQEQAQTLRQEHSDLKHQNESLCGTDALRRYATYDLNMMETMPVDRHVVGVLTQELRDRYTGAAAGTVVARNAQPPATGVRKVLLQLVDVNKAFADQADKF